jgi:hypothetical protein
MATIETNDRELVVHGHRRDELLGAVGKGAP